MKKAITLMFITIFAIAATVDCVEAGHRHGRGDNFVEGAIIGVGAAILGAAIISEINSPPRTNYIYVDRESRHDRYERERRHRDYDRYDRRENRHDRYDRDDRFDRRDRGYWSVERVWVPPIYRQRWNPGHYSRRGHWIPGGYDRVIIREGYWETKRIWVSN
ncbi:MAG: hypothetical protein HQK72_03070 [Desulfamplus sp.]|nr:hypothetical protein [Desulfamplus sp.]